MAKKKIDEEAVQETVQETVAAKTVEEVQEEVQKTVQEGVQEDAELQIRRDETAKELKEQNYIEKIYLVGEDNWFTRKEYAEAFAEKHGGEVVTI